MALFQDFFREVLQPFDSAACLTGAGDLIDLKYETLADIGTLSASAQIAIRYLPMKMGDVAILNDPYSGGTILSTMTLVTPLMTAGNGPGFYLAFRIGFRPRLVLSDSLEEEGLRIPPTPIAQNRELNKFVIEAIEKHPLCPDGFAARLENILPQVWKRVDAFEVIYKKNPQTFSNSALALTYQKTRDFFSHVLGELPASEAKVETRLDSGELIRLHLKLTGEKVIFDFSGTSPSKRLALTDSSTFGACFGALLTFTQKSIPINSGSFSLLQVNSPLGCLLNAKYPSPTFRGMTEGTAVVATTVLKALSKIVTSFSQADSAVQPSQIGIEFNNSRVFFDAVPGGVGATEKGHGADAIFYWTRNRLQNSVQEVEQRFPLMIHQIAIKQNSGGRGQFHGGNGLTKEYEVLEPAVLNWILPGPTLQAQGTKGGHAGANPEISIIKSTGEKLILTELEGKIPLHPHDRIHLTSGGGGGWGKSSELQLTRSS